MSNIKVITESILHLFVSSNVHSFTSETKFPKDMTIYALKTKLELITGCSADSMTVEAVAHETGSKICDLNDNDALLGSYPIDSGMRLHVIDKTKTKGEFEDTSGVKKFEISEEEYSKRTDTVQSFLKRNKLGKYNEEEMEKLRLEKEDFEKKELEMSESIKVGNRCEVNVPGGMSQRRGEVKFVGKVHFKPGIWIGVQYDEPTGKNDGCVEGQRYFTCPAKYGGFVKVNYITVGDFPEEEFNLTEDEM